MAELTPLRINGYIASYRTKPSSGTAYSRMSKADLEAEVAKRGIHAKGTKADLTAALEADDNPAV